MAKIKSNNPGAWVVSTKDRGRKSIKNGKVFLKNGSEFEIELFNPLKESVLAQIKLNGNPISKTGLVISPGQRVYLDCFIDDGKKFIFNTYDVGDDKETIEAISNNGLVEVHFYKEEIIRVNNWYNYTWYPWYPDKYSKSIYFDNMSNITTSGTFYNQSDMVNSSMDYGSTFTTSLSISSDKTISKSIETGRVEKGGLSNQKFEIINMEFEKNHISFTKIELLPESRKPLEVKEIKGSFNDIKINKSESDELIDLIKKLSDLHKSGILTDDEFKDKKSELLSKI